MKAFVSATLIFLSLSGATAAEIETSFNQPGFTGGKATTVEDKFIELISLAKSNSTIHVSIYDFDRVPIAEALIRASQRGVDVNMVLDGGLEKLSQEPGSAMNLLAASGSVKLHYCKGKKTSCRGDKHNHNKFILLSHLSDGRKDVVGVSSSNWTIGQHKNYNDLIILSGDHKLFYSTWKYWEDLREMKKDSPLVISGDSAEIYTFPNKEYDPIYELLAKVSCQLPGSMVRVVQSRFTDDRLKVAKQLVKLKKQGCDVRVITRDEPEHLSPGLLVRWTLRKIMQVLAYEGIKRPHLENTNHSKVVLVNAALDGSTVKVPVVLAGSHNMTGNSLKHNDELLVKVVDREAFDAYLKHWNEIAKGLLRQDKPTTP